MNKTIIKVPQGIKYVSDWTSYVYPRGHCIVDKGVTGCGYTEYCLRNELNTVLCSPRKMLLENKMEQHLADDNILYLKNDITGFTDLQNKFEQRMTRHITHCLRKGKPVKFLVTYDSAHYVVEYLQREGLLGKFVLVADEMQSLFLDSYYKAEVENSFLESIQVCPDIIYLSATPMLDKYLDMLPEFKNLDYYSLDWSETGYIETLQIQRKQTNSLGTEIMKIIKSYLSGDFPVTVNDQNKIVQSREAVLYVNSVTEIIRAITKSGLRPDQVNILCADTETNRRKVKRIKHSIGKIPLENEPRKMFTFCTSTCYIGADFYSDCASTYIFADPNLKWLALDISLDLPQIAGRQRNRENPFKNNITIFYKLIRDENLEDRAAFDALQAQRIADTNKLLSMHDDYVKVGDNKAATLLTKKLRDAIGATIYCGDFVSIDKNNKPVYNRLIEIANERAWEVSQKDYQDSICVTRALALVGELDGEYKDKTDRLIQDFLDNKFYKTPVFENRMRLFCEFLDQNNSDYVKTTLRHKIPDVRFHNYYYYFGTEVCKSMKFRDSNLRPRLLTEIKDNAILTEVYKRFKVGQRYLKKDIKDQLREAYFDSGINQRASGTTSEKINYAPKAIDLDRWFETKPVKMKVHGKDILGIELLSIKKV